MIGAVALAESDLSSPTGIAWGLRFETPSSDLPLHLLATKFAGTEAEFTHGEVDGSRLMELGVGKGVIDLATGKPNVTLSTDADISDPSTAEPYTVDAGSCVEPGA